MKHLLKEHNLKVTPQRLALLEQIHKHGHISIEELYCILITTFPSLSLATIYKNIIIMQNSLLLQEIKIHNEKSKYELTKDPHIHLICTKCGTIEDKHIDNNIKNVFDTLATNNSFEYDKYNLNLYGTCNKCKN